MVKLTFVAADGREHIVMGTPGVSLMESAKQHNVPGIDADCGGCCACGTCHVFIPPEWQARIGAPTVFESATMEFVEGVEPNSRLSCQIKVTDELSGLMVRLPECQR